MEENAELFARMRAGEFRNGQRVLRAKIDMALANINLRDPVICHILNASHPRTGAVWHIYPSYDFAHGQCDAIEEVSHSLCTSSSRTIDRYTTGSSTTSRCHRDPENTSSLAWALRIPSSQNAR